jgi:alkylation response protein AidB-like acyl-CoA dehydrogenase
MEQMGRRLTCAPFFSTVVLASNALLLAGSEAAQARWLPRIAAGALRATLALAGQGVGLGAPGVTAEHGAQGWTLDGQLALVPDGASAELLLVLARVDAGSLGLFAVAGDAAGLTRTARPTWDLTRRLASVSLQRVLLDEAARVDAGALSLATLQQIEARAALLLAAEQLGGAQQCLDLTLAYTAERAQFGQKIAAFQAVKHRCAEMMVAIEGTRSLVYGAAALADSGGEPQTLRLEAGAAKALADEAFFFCAQEAIQLHGGVGFTWEYDPHLYFKRAQAGSQWLGRADQWREHIAAALLD